MRLKVFVEDYHHGTLRAVLQDDVQLHVPLQGTPVTADSPPSGTAAPTALLGAGHVLVMVLSLVLFSLSAFLWFCTWTALRRELDDLKQAREEQRQESTGDLPLVTRYVWEPSADTVSEIVANAMRGEFTNPSTQTDEVYASKNDLSAFQVTADSRLDSLNGRTQDNETAIDKVNKTVVELVQEFSTCASQVRTQVDEFSRLTASHKDLDRRVGNVSEQYLNEAANLSTAVDGLQEDIENSRGRADDLEKRVKAAEGLRTHINQVLEAMGARVSTVEREVEGRIKALEEQDAGRTAPEHVQALEKRILSLESAIRQMGERVTSSEAAIVDNAGKANEKAHKQIQALVNHQGAIADLQRGLLVLGSAAAAEALVLPREKKPEGQALLSRLSREKIAESFPQTYAIKGSRLVTYDNAQSDSLNRVVEMTRKALDAYWQVSKIDLQTYQVLCQEVSASVFRRVTFQGELFDPEGEKKWVKVVGDEVTKAVQQLEQSKAAAPHAFTFSASPSVAGRPDPASGPASGLASASAPGAAPGLASGLSSGPVSGPVSGPASGFRLPARPVSAATSAASAPRPLSAGGSADKVASTSTPHSVVSPSVPSAASAAIQSSSSPSSPGAAAPTTASVPVPTRSSPPTEQAPTLAASRWAKDTTQEAKPSSKSSAPVPTASSPSAATSGSDPTPAPAKGSTLSSSRWATGNTQGPEGPSTSPAPAVTSALGPTPTPTTARAPTLASSRWATDVPQTPKVSSSSPAVRTTPVPTPTPASVPASAPPSSPSSGAMGVPPLREGPTLFLLPEHAPKMAAKHPEFWSHIPSLEELTNMDNDHKARWVVAKVEAERTDSLEPFRGVLAPELHHLLPPKVSAPLQEGRGGHGGGRGRGGGLGGRGRR